MRPGALTVSHLPRRQLASCDCRLSGWWQAEQRAILDSIHTAFGCALCGQGEVEEGLAHLALDSRASPVLLLRLFPDLAPAALLEPLLPGARAGHPMGHLQVAMVCAGPLARDTVCALSAAAACSWTWPQLWPLGPLLVGSRSHAVRTEVPLA